MSRRGSTGKPGEYHTCRCGAAPRFSYKVGWMTRAASVLGPAGPLAGALEGYEHRPEQLAMAELVERTLAADGIALVEAGTGTGKTLAYLVPAILSGKRVVISTGTKTLQDQIMQHDLPLLESHLGLSFSSAAMKGVSNYLCLRRY